MEPFAEENVSRYFAKQKKAFKIYAPLDPGVEKLILELNRYKDFVTNHSCEGHYKGDDGYISFNISPKLWDSFWSEFIPIFIYHFAMEANNSHRYGIEIHGALFIKPAIIFEFMYSEKERFLQAFEKYMLQFLNKHSKKSGKLLVAELENSKRHRIAAKRIVRNGMPSGIEKNMPKFNHNGTSYLLNRELTKIMEKYPMI